MRSAARNKPPAGAIPSYGCRHADTSEQTVTAGHRSLGGTAGPHLGSRRMRVIRSLLHPEDLAELVGREYDIPTPVKGKLLGCGFNDSYLLTDADGGRRVLR